MKNKFLILSLMITIAFGTPLASAAVNTSQSDTAGAEQSRSRENVEREKAGQEVEKRLSQKDAVTQDEEQVKAEDAAGSTFTLKQVKFSGNEHFTNADLQPVVKDYIG